MNTKGHRSKFMDPLVRFIAGAVFWLGVLVVAIASGWGRGSVIAPIPWFIPMMNSFLILVAASVTFLAFGRYQVLRDPASFWIGIGFSGFAVGTLFNVLTFPGLLPDGQPIIGSLSNTPAWAGTLALTILRISLLLAILLRAPGESALEGQRALWSIFAWIVFITLLNVLFVRYGAYLPVLLREDGSYTSLVNQQGYIQLLLSIVGMVLATRRYLRSGHALMGYVALCQTTLIILPILTIVGERRFDVWWFAYRVIWVVGFLVILFGLLTEYVHLFRREQDKARELLQSEQKFSLLFEKAAFAAALSRPPEGVLVNVNEAWVKVFGYSKPEAVGKTTLELNINPDSEGRARILAQLQESGSARDQELTLRTKSGEWRTLLTNVDVVEIGGQKYILNTTKDITERKRAEESLREALHRIEKLNQQMEQRAQDLENASEEHEVTNEELRVTNEELAGEIAQRRRAEETLRRSEEQTRQHLTRVQALREIDRAIAGSLDLRITLQIILNQVTTQLGVDAADILLFNSQMQTLEFALGEGFRTQALQQTRLHLGDGYAGQAALERRVVSVPDLVDQPNGLTRAPLLAREEFVVYHGAPLIAKGEIKGVLEVFHRSALNLDQDWLSFLETLAGQAAIAIESAELFADLQRSNTELMLAYDTTLEGWSYALDLRDKGTEGHTQRVVEVVLRLAREMHMGESELVHVRRGALLHDIGKMGIPDAILLKPGALTDAEWEIMRRHPTYAFNLLSPIAYLRPALDIPYCHHEKWDGTGYPRGLKGEGIPLAARLFAVVDVWDALRSDRPYRAAWTDDKVREYLQSEAGKHFDPQVVERFFKLISEQGYAS